MAMGIDQPDRPESFIFNESRQRFLFPAVVTSGIYNDTFLAVIVEHVGILRKGTKLKKFYFRHINSKITAFCIYIEVLCDIFAI